MSNGPSCWSISGGHFDPDADTSFIGHFRDNADSLGNVVTPLRHPRTCSVIPGRGPITPPVYHETHWKIRPSLFGFKEAVMCVFIFLAAWLGILWNYAQRMKVLLPPEETASVSVSAPLPVFTTGGRVFTIHDWALTSPDWVNVRKVRPKTSPAAKKSSVAMKGAKKP